MRIKTQIPLLALATIFLLGIVSCRKDDIIHIEGDYYGEANSISNTSENPFYDSTYLTTYNVIKNDGVIKITSSTHNYTVELSDFDGAEYHYWNGDPMYDIHKHVVFSNDSLYIYYSTSLGGNLNQHTFKGKKLP